MRCIERRWELTPGHATAQADPPRSTIWSRDDDGSSGNTRTTDETSGPAPVTLAGARFNETASSFTALNLNPKQCLRGLQPPLETRAVGPVI